MPINPHQPLRTEKQGRPRFEIRSVFLIGAAVTLLLLPWPFIERTEVADRDGEWYDTKLTKPFVLLVAVEASLLSGWLLWRKRKLLGAFLVACLTFHGLILLGMLLRQTGPPSFSWLP
jgi:hypothetical protein